MKQFFKRVGLFVIIIVLFLVILDVAYTSVFKHTNYTRSKVGWLRGLDAKESYDYAVFGSSRAYFNLNTLLIKERTGVKGINLAFPNSKTFETKLMVKLFTERFDVDEIFIQVDDQYEIVDNDPIAMVPFLPYIKDPIIYEAFSETVDNHCLYRYIPFYRYMKYDSKLGFREIMMNFYKKDKSYANNLGYGEASNKVMKVREEKFKFHLTDTLNIHLQEVIEICREKGIQVYFYTAPIYKAEGNLEVLEKNLPNYHDFSDSFDDAKFFRDPYHLNDVGTAVFTEQFINIYFKP